jgi:glycosyltransferase involved in cell wall biosynthesis
LPLAANGESAGSNSTIPNILFAGILCEGKGIVVLLDACRILGEFGFSFHLTCMGSFLPQGFEEHVRQKVHDDKLDKVVSFPGVLSGEKKHKAFTDADIFCFPSHYPSESFGVVLIEAMSYSLPIVATHWRGIPEVTGTDGAYLVPVQDAEALAATLQKLIVSPQLRRNMGQRNRIRYLEHFTLDRYRRNLEGHLHALL